MTAGWSAEGPRDEREGGSGGGRRKRRTTEEDRTTRGGVNKVRALYSLRRRCGRRRSLVTCHFWPHD